MKNARSFRAIVDSGVIAAAGVIAAMYAALCLLFAPISFGPAQLRVAEALTVLPYFGWGAIPGLFIGCIIANFYSPFGILDIVVGSLASLIAAVCTYFIGKKIKNRMLALFLAPLPPVLSNGILIALMITLVSEDGFSLGFFFPLAAQIAAEEFLVCYFLGIPLLIALEKIRDKAGLEKLFDN